MSKESYARGFCKVAAAYGVDAVKLAQYASDAGIGSLVQNDINLSVEHDRNGNVTLGTMLGNPMYSEFFRPKNYVKGSYRSAIYKNLDDYDSADLLNQAFLDLGRKRMAKFKSDREKASALEEKITSEELDAMRKEQASHIANRYFPSGTAPWEKMVRNLIESGRLNHKQYIEGGRINPETKYPALDEKMETPSDFINFQKSMVRGPGKNYNSKNEIQGTERA